MPKRCLPGFTTPTASITGMGLHNPDHSAPAGRRISPRLRVQLPVQIITLEGQGQAVLENISLTGARFASDLPVRIGMSCLLRLQRIELFGDITWQANGRAGLIFDEELSPGQLVALRDLDLSPAERTERLDWARGFVDGTLGSGR